MAGYGRVEFFCALVFALAAAVDSEANPNNPGSGEADIDLSGGGYAALASSLDGGFDIVYVVENRGDSGVRLNGGVCVLYSSSGEVLNRVRATHDTLSFPFTLGAGSTRVARLRGYSDDSVPHFFSITLFFVTEHGRTFRQTLGGRFDIRATRLRERGVPDATRCTL